MTDAAVAPIVSRSFNAGSAKIAAIAAAFIGLAAGWPSSFGSTATAFIVPLTKEFGWGRIVPSLMYTCSMLGAVVASLVIGRVITRFGAALVAAVSGLCLTAAMLLLANQNGTPALALSYCFLAGALGSGTGVGLYLSVLPRWFDVDLGRALGLSVVGQSAGLTIMPAIASQVITAHGWRSGYTVLALVQVALTLVAAAVLWWLQRSGRHALVDTSARSSTGATLSQALGGRTFWLLAVMMFLITFGVLGAAIHLFPIYIDRHVSRKLLPLVAIALGVGTFGGRVGAGVLLDHFEARSVALATFAIGAAGIVWLALSGQPHDAVALYLPPVLIGTALGAESDILAYMCRRYFGLLNYSVIYNRALIGFFAGALTGPVAIGWASDHLAEPAWVLGALAVSCAAAMAVSFALPSTKSTALKPGIVRPASTA